MYSHIILSPHIIQSNHINQYNTQLLRIASTISSLPNIVRIVFIVEYLSIDTISFCYADVMMRSWWILADVIMMSWWCQHLFSFWFYYGRTHSILRSVCVLLSFKNNNVFPYRRPKNKNSNTEKIHIANRLNDTWRRVGDCKNSPNTMNGSDRLLGRTDKQRAYFDLQFANAEEKMKHTLTKRIMRSTTFSMRFSSECMNRKRLAQQARTGAQPSMHLCSLFLTECMTPHWQPLFFVDSSWDWFAQ